MNIPTNVTMVFYHFHEPSKLVHDSSRPTRHVANLKFHDSGPLPLVTSRVFQTNFINLFTLCVFCILNFLISSFCVLCVLDIYRSYLLCVYLEASSFDVNFCKVFHYNTSKPEQAIHEIDYAKLWIWVPDNESCSQHAMKSVENSSWIACPCCELGSWCMNVAKPIAKMDYNEIELAISKFILPKE